MAIAAICLGAFLILLVLVDTFETIILPRTVDRPLRLASGYWIASWKFWRLIGCILKGSRRQSWLGAYGPLSLICLIGLWAVCQILGFGLLNWGLQTPLIGISDPPLADYLFFSGGAFFTVGSDYVPANHVGHLLGIFESGLGFMFLAIVISYIPVLASAFSKREVQITLLDARAGSPPSAVELFRRYAEDEDMEAMPDLLKDWERWSAELLESYLSYPVLAYYRSQHERQSWLASITTIMDVCALAQLGFQEEHSWSPKLRRQAKLTFAIARHACVDLALILRIPPERHAENRLDGAAFQHLRKEMEACGITLCSRSGSESDLGETRALYEGYVAALSDELFLDLPKWMDTVPAADNWQNSAFEAHDHFGAAAAQ